MNKKKLRYAFNKVLEVSENTKCEQLNHPTKYLHAADEMCPAEYHLQKQAYIIREYMKENNIYNFDTRRK